MKLFSVLILAIAYTVAADPWYAEFTVNLEPGKTGKFVMEVQDL